MRTVFCLLTAVLISAWGDPSQFSHKSQLKPYVEFLRIQKTSAKHYILRLFDDHDIVILCERDHRDITQYELFLSIIEDNRFIDSVANIFTEIGVGTLNPELNNFLHRQRLSTDAVKLMVMDFQRDCSIFPIWDKPNFSFFVHRLYELNQRLAQEKKVNLYPSDMPFDWHTMSVDRLKDFWDRIRTRDSVIASQIIRKFDEISRSPAKRKKALVIMNYRHAFGHRFEHPVGVKPDNVGRYLFERYGERVANVFVNYHAILPGSTDRKAVAAAIQNGKWDAAFKALQLTDVGFSFDGSPFGEDQFDIWPLKQHFKYKDVFDGFVFYKPVDEHLLVVGIPGIIDSVFAPEILRRYALYNELPIQTTKLTSDLHSIKTLYNVKREFRYEMLDSLTAQIQQWLR
jgi:hypothetical protein